METEAGESSSARAEQLALLQAPVVPPVPATADADPVAKARGGRRNNPMQNITLSEGTADPAADAPVVLTGP
eukprot:14294382-Heterocapsa_arctica.AAC.1